MAQPETFESVDDILDFAIAREEESVRFYTALAEKSARSAMTQIFEQFAQEEKGHKAKLERVKAGNRMLSRQREVMDLKMADYLVQEKSDAELDYQEALIVAMKKEKKAFMLYSDLATRVADDELAKLFAGLAQEEAKHKLRFEVEYDENILTEN
jgi:rubrerythrin